MKLYFYTKQLDSHGVRVIVDNFAAACARANQDCQIITSLRMLFSPGDIVISYGVKESLEVIKKGIPPTITYLTDAISLGYLNKIKFYWKHRNLFQYDFFYSIYGYLRYSRQEKLVCKRYKKIVLVSPVDINYLQNMTRQPFEKFIYVPNGVDIAQCLKPTTTSNQIRLGLLASWAAKQTYQESAWFVKEYFSKYISAHPNVTLKLIGRGSYIDNLRGLAGVEVIGEVDSLTDAFSEIDIFVGVNPKGCGVLNRVLDAMSYKKPILSMPECFTGLPDSESLYFKFTDYYSFESQIDYIINHPEEVKCKVDNSFIYVKNRCNWQQNYDDFINSQIIPLIH